MEELLTILSYILYMVTVCVVLVWLVKELTMGIYTGTTRLEGKLVVITGANCGIGLETARDLAARGARVILGCRSKQRGQIAVKDIIDSTGNSGVEMIELDLLSLESVRRFAQLVAARNQPLHILINNAGMTDGAGLHSWAVGRSHLSEDGLEIVTQTNHLSHFLLTNLLKDRLKAAGNSRVINVSSVAGCGGKLDLNNVNYEKDSSTGMLKKNYHNSKLMNIMFTKELSKRWADIGVTSYSLHPGFVRTEIFRSFSHPDQNFISVLVTSWGRIFGREHRPPSSWPVRQTSRHRQEVTLVTAGTGTSFCPDRPRTPASPSSYGRDLLSLYSSTCETGDTPLIYNSLDINRTNRNFVPGHI